MPPQSGSLDSLDTPMIDTHPQTQTVTADAPTDVWIVNRTFYPIMAGPALRFMGYAPGFKKRGVNSTFVTAMRENLPANDVMDGVPILRLGDPDKEVLSLEAFINKVVLEALKRRPRVMIFLICSSHNTPMLQLLRLAGIKTIYVNTMSWSESPSPNPIKKSFSNMINRRMFLSFSHLVCSTEKLFESFSVLRYPKSKVRIIANGVDLNRFKPADADEIKALRRELELPEDRTIALFVGLRIDRKGVLDLVRGWKKYRENGGDGLLVLVGQDARHDDWRAPFYEEWDQLLTEVDGVEVRPPSSEVQKYFRACDLFAFLSKLEGMPNVIPEAMACGTPIMMTRFEGFSDDYGQTEREFIMTERDTDQIAGHLTRLMSNAQLRRDIGNRARHWVESHHDREISLDKYVDLIKSLSR